MMTERKLYRFEIQGQITGSLAALFADMATVQHHRRTVLEGRFDHAALHGLLDRIRDAGLDLHAVHCIEPSEPR